MSKTTYTPGPWHFDERQAGTGDTGSVEALTPDGKMVTREICTVLFDDDDPSEDAANARLIAAAPALLAACKAVAEWFGASSPEDEAVLKQVHAAIDQAERH